ncbi:DUF4349 domain-containing protein [Streptomyces sp. NPDC001135]
MTASGPPGTGVPAPRASKERHWFRPPEAPPTRTPRSARPGRRAAGGAWAATWNTGRDGDGHEHTRVVLRVPGAKYGDVLAGLRRTGRRVDRRAQAVDVTGRVVDVDSRVTSQRAGVNRIRALMAWRPG